MGLFGSVRKQGMSLDAAYQKHYNRLLQQQAMANMGMSGSVLSGTQPPDHVQIFEPIGGLSLSSFASVHMSRKNNYRVSYIWGETEERTATSPAEARAMIKDKLLKKPKDECLNIALPKHGYLGQTIGLRFWKVREEGESIPGDLQSFSQMLFAHHHSRKIKWKGDTDSLILTSQRGTEWPTNCALECEHNLDVGIFAYRNFGTLEAAEAERTIFGLVALWGGIYEYEKGYRATHAFPYAFVPTLQTGDLCKQMSEKYNVPILPKAHAEYLLTRF